MFSVIIPVYNHARYLEAAVISALRSPLVNEILLIDDGSSDHSVREIHRLAESNPRRIHDLTGGGGENHGAPARLNELISFARSEWIAVLNSDDTFVPGRFEQVHALLRRTKISFAWGHLLIMNEHGTLIGSKRGALEPEYPFPREFDVRQLLADNALATLLANQNLIATTSNMVFTKQLHSEIGGFTNYRYVHDWDFALRAAMIGETLFTPLFLTSYRVHPSNTISENLDATRAEVCTLFSRFHEDFPEATSKHLFDVALRGNRYLHPGQTHAST